MKEKNLYEVMGISNNASTQEVKDAYRKLAHKYHPDKTSTHTDAEKFICIKDAYDVLMDKERRRQYDKELIKPEGSFTEGIHEVYPDFASPSSPHISFWGGNIFLSEIFEMIYNRNPKDASGNRSRYDHRHYDDLLG